MAKRKSAGAKDPECATDVLLDAVTDELGRSGVYRGDQAEDRYVGLPLPALCLRYLWQQTIFPLSRITQITGEEGSCKSAFLSEILRWHCTHGGGGYICENENKDNAEFRNSILEWNPIYLRRVNLIPTYCTEEWQEVVGTTMREMARRMDAPGGPGRTVPMFWGVDSLFGTATRGEIERQDKDGYASRGYAEAALLITRFTHAMPSRLKDYPFTLVGTNHVKPSTDWQGRPIRRVLGGKSVKFHESFEVEIQKAPNPHIDLLDYGGLRLKLTMNKNSGGASDKCIGVDILWWNEVDENEQLRQRTLWDWDTASIRLLLSFEIAKGKKTIYNRLMDVCDLHVVNKQEQLVWSRALEIPEKSPVHFREAGAILETRPDLLVPIHHILGIKTRQVFQPGERYNQPSTTPRVCSVGGNILTRSKTRVTAATKALPDEEAVLPEKQNDESGVETEDNG